MTQYCRKQTSKLRCWQYTGQEYKDWPIWIKSRSEANPLEQSTGVLVYSNERKSLHWFFKLYSWAVEDERELGGFSVYENKDFAKKYNLVQE